MYSVLFVDDEPTAKIISQSMADWAKLRLKITAAVNNGAEALAYLESHEADAVITDLQMPVMDGLTLIRELRSRGFKGPILALSNYSEYNLVRGALTEGAYDYLINRYLHQDAGDGAAKDGGYPGQPVPFPAAGSAERGG